ncbi:MAG: LamG-like jellyroll fold domain-containing protein, partial [Patescibacteria group bacterium]
TVTANGFDFSGVSAGIGSEFLGVHGEDFPGLIDDVRVYNRALSADEIKRLYNLGGTFTVNKSQSTGTLKDGLVGHWTFDEKDMPNDQTAGDASGQGNNGTLTNDPVRAIGRIGQALNFDGNNDYVNLGTRIGPDNLPVTISGWINTTNVSASEGIFSTDKTQASAHNHTGIWFNISQFTAGVIDVSFGADTNCGPSGRRTKTGTTVLSANQWYHVAAVVGGATDMSLYINGVDDGGTYAGTGGSIVYSGNVGSVGKITNCADGTDIAFSGLIDDVRVYNRALSKDEIKRLYNMGR